MLKIFFYCLFLTIFIYGCNSASIPYEEETVVVINGKAYDCISEKLDGVWHGITRCWDDSLRLRIKETYKNGLLDGYTIYFHEDGSVLSKQQFVKGKSNRIQYYYYPSGQLYSYVYLDSSLLYPLYKRTYDVNGELLQAKFPIDIQFLGIEKNLEWSKDSVLIKIELEHSEFDSSFVCALINEDPRDWCFVGSTHNPLQIIYLTYPDSAGRIYLSGVLFEYLRPEIYMGEHPFEFEYFIKDWNKAYN